MTVDNRSVAARLKQARIAAGFKTAKQFADTHSIPQPTFALHESGRRGLTREVATAYAGWLGVSVEWLLTGKLDAAARAPAMLRGYVGAGAEVHPFPDESGIEPIEAPPGCGGCDAYLVRGDSMEPVYRDGDILFPDSRTRSVEDIAGRDCVVQVHDGPRLVKRVHRGGGRSTVRLFSYATQDLTDDLRIDWAQPIIWVKRDGR